MLTPSSESDMARRGGKKGKRESDMRFKEAWQVMEDNIVFTLLVVAGNGVMVQYAFNSYKKKKGGSKMT